MMAEPKPVPLGKPLHLTDKQLDELSKVTPADIEKAKQLWRNTAPPAFETLLDAETIDDQVKP
jgi:hypothetical protein